MACVLFSWVFLCSGAGLVFSSVFRWFCFGFCVVIWYVGLGSVMVFALVSRALFGLAWLLRRCWFPFWVPLLWGFGLFWGDWRWVAVVLRVGACGVAGRVGVFFPRRAVFSVLRCLLRFCRWVVGLV